MDTSILVTTPTGAIGGNVITILVKAGHRVHVLARRPKKLNAELLPTIEVIKGSSGDPKALRQVLKGVRVLFWVTPPDGAGRVLDVYTKFAEGLVKVLSQSDVTHVVNVSSGGKGVAKDAGPISALHTVEDILNTTGLAIRHLRCGNFMENYLYHVETLKHGKLLYPMRGDVTVPTVATKDIASVAVTWLKKTNWTGQEGVGVHGPEDLSLDDTVDIFSNVLGQKVQFQKLTPDAYRKTMKGYGMEREDIEDMLGMFRAVEKNIYRAEPRTSETTTPTTLEAWAKTTLRPLLKEGALS